MNQERVIAYIDGFNLYHAIDALNQPHLKWLDLRALVSSFLNVGQVLTAVNYYSAYATWMPEAHARHRQYANALRAVGVSVHLSEFRDRPQECFQCGNRWIAHEEKRTDVRMAVDIVADCLEGTFDVALIINSNSDILPAVAKIRSKSGKRLLMVSRPGRFNRARDLHFSHQIRRGRIARCLLPPTVIDNGRVVVTRPPEYDPPA